MLLNFSVKLYDLMLVSGKPKPTSTLKKIKVDWNPFFLLFSLIFIFFITIYFQFKLPFSIHLQFIKDPEFK